MDNLFLDVSSYKLHDFDEKMTRYAGSDTNRYELISYHKMYEWKERKYDN